LTKRAIVIGGSIGGLFAAALLHRQGWRVDVYERSEVELAGRGAGIVTHPPLLEALVRCGASLDDLGVAIETRTGYDEHGEVIRQVAAEQIVTSWDRLHTLTRAQVLDEHHHLDHALAHHEVLDDGVRATFTNGHTVQADLLIGADGFRSAVRAQMQPDVQPEYAGYVVWRGVAAEADLPPEIRDGVFGTFGFHLPADGEVIGYPIAGENNVLEPGRRRYNWVWYRVVEPAALTDLLTDASGHTHEISIPPPLVRPDVVQRLRDDAERVLCEPFRVLLSKVPAPFFTPIYDHLSPVMARDRVVLVGDSACVARPHVGMGVTKAASDACALVDALGTSASLDEALASYDRERVEASRIAYERARHLGEYLRPEWTTDEERAVWTATHDLESIMRDTATMNFY